MPSPVLPRVFEGGGRDIGRDGPCQELGEWRSRECPLFDRIWVPGRGTRGLAGTAEGEEVPSLTERVSAVLNHLAAGLAGGLTVLGTPKHLSAKLYRWRKGFFAVLSGIAPHTTWRKLR